MDRSTEFYPRGGMRRLVSTAFFLAFAGKADSQIERGSQMVKRRWDRSHPRSPRSPRCPSRQLDVHWKVGYAVIFARLFIHDENRCTSDVEFYVGSSVLF